MSKDKDSRVIISFPVAHKKRAQQIAALLELGDWLHVLSLGLQLVEGHAEASVRGKTAVAFCAPKLTEVLESNPEFIAALCEEGVVEWLTPFVLAKSKQSNHPATDTTQS
jgi:hypothetical protein